MAHIAKLGALTDELVTLLTSVSPKTNPSKFNVYRESALRSLRYNNYARTNQFDVQQSLEGLEEKFRVYNEDAVADALHDRIENLSQQSTKWTPEILHLLLELSDKPVMNSKLEYLEFHKQPEVSAERVWKWEDLVAEDPQLSEKHIWRNVDFGAESSDDDVAFPDSNESSGVAETTLSSVEDNDFWPVAHLPIVADSSCLQQILTTQFWKPSAQEKTGHSGLLASKNNLVTERQAIREVLFMLQGLPTSMFERHHDRELVETVPGFTLCDSSPEVFYGLLEEFARYGTDIHILRSWVTSKKTVPLLQSLQQEIEYRLQDFDKQLSNLQGEFMDPHNDVVVSLVSVQSKLSLPIHLLNNVSEVITRMQQEPYAHAFRYLELLFEKTCTSQNAGNDALYHFMGELFFNCFNVYLQPMKMWMECGQLLRDDSVFFVFESDETTDIGLLWQNRFKLRRTKDGTLHAPRFLHSASNKIFTTGKSVVLLNNLGQRKISSAPKKESEPVLDFQNVCNPDVLSLIPFPDLLNGAFERWVQSKHHAASSILSNCLFENQGLRSCLDALEIVYFMADGAASGNFANVIFDKLNGGSSSWNDRFTLTELIQSTVGDAEAVTADALRVSIRAIRQISPQKSRLSVTSLSAINVRYDLPWPVQIIITSQAITWYQHVFIFLLQIRYAAHLMEGVRLLRDTSNINSSADERALYYSTRSRLLWFTSTLYNYLTEIVIRSSTVKMRELLEQAEDVDQMIDIHRSYMKRLADCALLGTRLDLIHKSVITILDLSIRLFDARASHFGMHDPSNSLRPPPAQGEGRPRPQPLNQSFNDADDDEASDTEPGIISTDEPELPYIENLRIMKSQFDHLCKFVTTGLRGIARAGGEPNWDVLAEKLELGAEATQ